MHGQSGFGRQKMFLLVGISMLPLSTVSWPQPYAENAIFENSTGRYAVIQSSVTFGVLKQPLVGVVGDVEVSQCGSDAAGPLYYGVPPQKCRVGKRFDGVMLNGYAQIPVVHENVVHIVLYPSAQIPTESPTQSVGPFSHCSWVNQSLHCAAERASAYYANNQTSIVWVDSDKASDALMILYCLWQSAVLALVASSTSIHSDPSLMAAALDSAVGGALAQAYLGLYGRGVFGITRELGSTAATAANVFLTSVSIALATVALIVSSTKKDLVMPWVKAIRESYELPIIVSLSICWPTRAGPNYIMVMQFASGIAFAYICGRAACRSALRYTGYAAAVPSLATALALTCGSILILPLISVSGVVARGTQCIALSTVISASAVAAGAISPETSVNEQVKTSSQTLKL